MSPVAVPDAGTPGDWAPPAGGPPVLARARHGAPWPAGGAWRAASGAV